MDQAGFFTHVDLLSAAVSFVQRFGDTLRLNPHFHTLAMDGLYIVNERGELVFRLLLSLLIF